MYKRLILIFLLVGCSHVQLRLPASHSTYDIVFDLDWTALYNFPEGTAPKKGRQFINYDKRVYRIVDWFEESVHALLEIPGVRISVFTGGSKERSDYLLKQIKLPDGTPLIERIHLNLSYADLSPVKNPTGTAFFDKRKKDLSRFFTDLDSTILIEDDLNAVPKSQRKNLLWLQETYNFHETFPVKSVSKFDPPTNLHFKAERNKMVWTFDMLRHALLKSKETGKRFTDIIWEVSHNAEGSLKKKSRTDQLKRIKKAIGKFRMKYGNDPCLARAVPFN